MNLSERGYEKIRSYEGYHRALPDGTCTAYQENINGKLDIPTIGYGCTKGVTMGMVWTREQAEAELRKEIATHEARVNRLVTVELNQNQFDALVSFDFNTGGLTLAGGAPSGVLKAVNSNGDVVSELKRWNKFGGSESKGLTARRADESALWLEPVGESAPDTMPQAPEQAAQPVSRSAAATIAATIGAAAGSAPAIDLASVTAKATEFTSAASAFNALGQVFASVQAVTATLIGVCFYLALTYVPKLLGRSS